jgi:putative membrane protein
MAEYYMWLKAFHLIFVISWLAGLFYLPRLFVYHCELAPGSKEDKLFQVMEKKLLRVIMNPAMVLSLVFGLWIASIYGFRNLGGWFHIKMTLVLIMLYFHHFLGRRRKDFENSKNRYSAKFYRVINEIPAILMVIIVILAIVKPFE